MMNETTTFLSFTQLMLIFENAGLHRRPRTRLELLSPQVEIYKPDKIILHKQHTLLFDYDIALVSSP